jgi:formylglycine-generating enzyme required for sulfatase activity
LAFWNSIKDSDDPAMFEAYLKRYPAGEFAEIARLTIAAAKGSGEPQTVSGVPPGPRLELEPVEATYVAVKNANVREQPTVRSATVTMLSRGAQVHVAGKVRGQNWYLVERDDQPLGYVYAELLQDAETARAQEAGRQPEDRRRLAEGRGSEAERPRPAPAEVALAPPARPDSPGPVEPAVGVYPAPPGGGFRDCADCPVMVVIPAGSFVMGSPAGEPGRDDNEGPQHEVTIPRAFALGRHEVTFAEWDACVRGGGCRHRADDMGWGRGPRPVIDVSWDDADDYVRWLSRKTGQEYRLPSEAEWEYAVRAGSATARSAPRFWGGDPADACRYANVYDLAGRSALGLDWAHHDCQDGYAQTAPVGRFRPNDFGLYDVLGNVWEWMADCWHDSYQGAPGDGGAWLTGDCTRRVLRGGSWNDGPTNGRSANRLGDAGGNRYIIVGFRLTRTLP